MGNRLLELHIEEERELQRWTGSERVLSKRQKDTNTDRQADKSILNHRPVKQVISSKNAIMLEGIGTCHKPKYMTGGSLNPQRHGVCVCVCVHVCMDFEEHHSMFD